MKTMRYIFALGAFLLVSQAAYCMYLPASNMYYIDGNGVYYQYDTAPYGPLVFQPVPTYPAYSTYPMYSAYPEVQQNVGFSIPEPFYPAKPVLSYDVELDAIDTDIKTFFKEIICDEELFSFAESLLENARKNDAIELVSKGAQYRSGPKPAERKPTPPNLKKAAYLKGKALKSYLQNYNEDVQTRIQELFCSPLQGNNLIQLSDFAYNKLWFSDGEVEIICILSLALFTTFKIFNGIDRLRWAVKKGLWQLTEKTLSEGIHPNWVVERGGMTALRTSVVNGDSSITDLLLSVNYIDTTCCNYNYQKPYFEQVAYFQDVDQMTEQMKNLLML